MIKFPDNKNFITPSIPMAILLIVSYLAMWTGNFMIKGYTGTGLMAELLQGWFAIAGFFILMLIHAVNLLLIAQINNRFAIVRVRTFIPIFIFALLMVVWYNEQTNIISFIALFVWFICIILIMSNYKNIKGMESAFLLFILLFCISLLNPVYLLLIPVFWIAQIIIKGMSLRVFLATLAGLILPLLLYISYLFITEKNDFLIPDLKLAMSPGISLDFGNIVALVYAGLLLTIVILCLIGLFSNIYSDTVQNRKNTYLLLFFISVLSLIILFFPLASGAFLPMLAACIAFVIAHPVTLKKSDFYKSIFYILILINLTFYFFRLFYKN